MTVPRKMLLYKFKKNVKKLLTKYLNLNDKKAWD